MQDNITRLFDHLDDWRHLPAYQLERRADIFFALYLPEAIEAATGVAIAPGLIPELPIKKDLIWPEQSTNSSVKVDYAAFSADRKTLFLVELKTDVESRRDQQDHYLRTAAQLGFAAILQGIKQIVLHTRAHQKYGHLLHALSEHGCMELPDGLTEMTFAPKKRGLRALQREIRVSLKPGEFQIEVLYVQPLPLGGDRCIDFDMFADVVERQADPLSREFARCLRSWVSPAGERRPK